MTTAADRSATPAVSGVMAAMVTATAAATAVGLWLSRNGLYEFAVRAGLPGAQEWLRHAAHLGPGTAGRIAVATGPAPPPLAARPAGPGAPRVAANGPMWRLRSLIAMGHTTGRIAAALAVPAHVIEPLIRGDRATISPALRDDIGRLFGAWWDKHPPRHTPAEKAAARKALQRAAAHNWPTPAGLDEDELDQPGYQPAARWRYAHGTGTATADPLGKTHQPQPPRHRPQDGRSGEPGHEAG